MLIDLKKLLFRLNTFLYLHPFSFIVREIGVPVLAAIPSWKNKVSS